MSEGVREGEQTGEGGREWEGDVLLELPFAVVERTDLPSLQPTRDAVEVERMLQAQPPL